MSDRAMAVASAARQQGSWLGELRSMDIQELRRAGMNVQIFNQTARGDWACEVTP